MEKHLMKAFKKNEENPFLNQTIEEITSSTTKRYKMATNQSESAILHAVDPHTGEKIGHTTFIKQIKVDQEQFVKIYLSRFSAFLGLNTQAMKVIDYILNQLKPDQDKFEFILDKCKKYTKYKSHTPIYIGMKSLLENKIIARGPIDSVYYINPTVVFNGNRITFADTYLKAPENQKQQLKYQENQLGFESEKSKLIESLREENKKLKYQITGAQAPSGIRQMTLEKAIGEEKKQENL
jgi:hypothetical protein